MRVVGIDPGLSGGAFVYYTDTFEFQAYKLERFESSIDQLSLFSWVSRQHPDHVFIEKILLTGREGGQSAMTIGSNYGRILAALDFADLTYTEVPPKVWQRSLGLKGGSREIIKSSAQELAIKRFTLLPFLEGKSKKPHDGLTDAACIALYGINFLSERLWDDQKNKSIKSTKASVSASGTSRKKKRVSKSKETKASKISKRTSKTSQRKRKAS